MFLPAFLFFVASFRGLWAQNRLVEKEIESSSVAQRLEIRSADLKEATSFFADALEGRRPLEERCEASESHPDYSSFCVILNRYRSEMPSPKTIRMARRGIVIRPQLFQAQQSFDLEVLGKALEREKIDQLLTWAPALLNTKTCPRNLSVAMVRRLEAALPQPRARILIRQLYQHASPCLRPQDKGYESFHFRQALLRVLWNDPQGARAAIEKAALAESPSERARTLYWAGYMQTRLPKKRIYWDELVRDYPLSFHALEVWRARGEDPLKIFSSSGRGPLTPDMMNANDFLMKSIAALEALYLYGHVTTAQKFSLWLTRAFKGELSKENKLHISLLKSSKSTPLNTIHFVTRQVSENPELLNRQVLEILFPRPFQGLISEVAGPADTALILAVARQESGFNPTARSVANAQGLLQVIPSTARLLNNGRSGNLFDVETNTRLGVKFLKQLTDRFGSIEKALAAYNAGPMRVVDWDKRYSTEQHLLFADLIPFKETRNYVTSILRNHYWYHRLYRDEWKESSHGSLGSLTQRSVLATRLIASIEHQAGAEERPETQKKN